MRGTFRWKLGLWWIIVVCSSCFQNLSVFTLLRRCSMKPSFIIFSKWFFRLCFTPLRKSFLFTRRRHNTSIESINLSARLYVSQFCSGYRQTESSTLRLQSDQPHRPAALQGLAAGGWQAKHILCQFFWAARRDRCGHLVVAARTGPKSRLWAICVVVKAPWSLGAPAPGLGLVCLLDSICGRLSNTWASGWQKPTVRNVSDCVDYELSKIWTEFGGNLGVKKG